MPVLEKLTSTDFSAHINQPFTLELETLPPILLQLRAVQKLDNNSSLQPGYHQTQFAVVFNGPLRPILPQQLYNVQHPTMGKLTFLFTPIGPSGASMQYKATLA
ncbi:MAG: hypothetical protein R2932_24920 [Caldilineaceae bacterium]